MKPVFLQLILVSTLLYFTSPQAKFPPSKCHSLTRHTAHFSQICFTVKWFVCLFELGLYYFKIVFILRTYARHTHKLYFSIILCLDFKIPLCLDFSILLCLDFSTLFLLDFKILLYLDFTNLLCLDFKTPLCLDFKILFCSEFSILFCLDLQSMRNF